MQKFTYSDLRQLLGQFMAFVFIGNNKPDFRPAQKPLIIDDISPVNLLVLKKKAMMSSIDYIEMPLSSIFDAHCEAPEKRHDYSRFLCSSILVCSGS